MIEQEKPKTAAACRHLTDNGLEEIPDQSMGVHSDTGEKPALKSYLWIQIANVVSW